jgi:hypothetical protein
VEPNLPTLGSAENVEVSIENGNRPRPIVSLEDAMSELRTREGANLSFGYENWCAVAGYFDGDGGLDVESRKHTLHWVLNFTDNWPPQLLQVKLFMEGQGVKVGTVRRTGVGGFKIEVAAIKSLKRCAEAMLETRCLFKKRAELAIMLRYFSGNVTGNEVIAFLNQEVTGGIRVGKLRMSDLPCTYEEGLRIYKKGYRRNGQSPLQALTEGEKEEVRKAYVDCGVTIYQLAPEYGVSPSTIFKAVGGLRRGLRVMQ